jgi:fluoroacetyl-CoA thioesterase
MEIKAQAGLTKTLGMKVRNEHTAANYGSGMIDVLATPAMIGLMEKTAQNTIQPYLPEGFISLGTEINAKHTKATLLGMHVFCEAKLIKVEGKNFHFEINAWDEKGNIGSATHIRHIVESKKFMEKLEKQ